MLFEADGLSQGSAVACLDPGTAKRGLHHFEAEVIHALPRCRGRQSDQHGANRSLTLSPSRDLLNYHLPLCLRL